jgi:hypothetical protein
MRVKIWIAIALVLGLAPACDYTPNLPPAPAPSATTAGGVVVVPVASPGPAPIPVPVPSPGEFPPPGSTFTIVMATPPELSTINLTDSSVAQVHRPTLDDE